MGQRGVPVRAFDEHFRFFFPFLIRGRRVSQLPKLVSFSFLLPYIQGSKSSSISLSPAESYYRSRTHAQMGQGVFLFFSLFFALEEGRIQGQRHRHRGGGGHVCILWIYILLGELIGLMVILLLSFYVFRLVLKSYCVNWYVLMCCVLVSDIIALLK
jgi:hypothetical protein